MTRSFIVAAVAVLAAACAKPLTADEARAALPRPEAAQIGTPPDASASAQLAAAAATGAVAPAEADPTFDPGYVSTSEYARTTYFTAWTVNGGALWVLRHIRFIATVFPPTSCADDACTWGPWDEQRAGTDLATRRWQLVVARSGEGRFDYTLSAMNLLEPAGFLPIVTGVAFPNGGPRGHGTFTVSFDNLRQLPDPRDDFGVLTVAYSSEGAAKVDATFVGARDADSGTLMNAAYAFQATGTGGALQIAFETREGAARAVSLHSRWDGTGAGRGDAQYHATDGSWTVTYGASECWDGRAARFSLAWDTDPAFGDMSACADAFEGDPQYASLVVP